MAACFLCGREDLTEECSSCGLVSFCSDHRTVHRPNNYCHPYTIALDKELGHHLVATRDIRALELIESEGPLVTGPLIKSTAQCLTCCKIVNGEYRCMDCNFPMCGPECAGDLQHSKECQLLHKIGFRACVPSLETIDKQYCAITTLRLLLVMEQDKNEAKSGTSFSFSNNLLDHYEDSKEENDEMWKFHKEFVSDFIRKICKQQDRFSELDVFRAIGILQTNASNLEFPDNNYGKGIGLYPIYAMMNHSCLSNTKNFKLADHWIEVRAQVDIKAGEEITNQYVKPDTPTFLRRPLLRSRWHFDCFCQRCSDPTELGSFLSGLICQRRRCEGTVLSKDSLDNQSDWACTSCHVIWPFDKVLKVVENCESCVKQTNPTEDVVEHYERVLHLLSHQLHPGHYILLDVKQNLGMILGNCKPYLIKNLSRPLKERKVQVCQDVLDTLSCLDRGYTKWRGKMMGEVTKTRMTLVLQDFEKDGGNRQNFHKMETKSKKRMEKVFQQKQFVIMYLAYYQSVMFAK